MKTILFFLAIGALAAGCVKLADLTQADVERGSQKFPGLSLNELNEGKSLFKVKCTQCHPMKNPSSRDEETWKKIVPKMAAKADKKPKKNKISPADQEKILRYLITMSLPK